MTPLSLALASRREGGARMLMAHAALEAGGEPCLPFRRSFPNTTIINEAAEAVDGVLLAFVLRNLPPRQVRRPSSVITTRYLRRAAPAAPCRAPDGATATATVRRPRCLPVSHPAKSIEHSETLRYYPFLSVTIRSLPLLSD